MKKRQYKFNGNKYILVGSIKKGGAIATDGQPSYAHLFEDGVIRQHGEEIGKRKDLKFLGWVEVSINFSEAMQNSLSSILGLLDWSTRGK